MNEIAPPLADGRYRLLSVLGQGGMAIVYRAFDERLQAMRAIKVLMPELVKREKVRTRFENEARTLARLTHNNLVTVHDVGIDGDRVYFVMEWLPGGSLRDRVKRDGPLTLGDAVDLIDATLAGLGYAHEHGVIHRDIKPQNILLTAEGDVRVADFGIARTTTGGEPTRHGAVMGTWAYMAPEQRNSATHAAPASDLYAVTATFYYLLTARDPVDLHASESHEALFTGIHPAVSAFLAQGTRYQPEARFADATAMRTALRGLLEKASSNLSMAAPEETGSPPESSDTFGMSSLDAEESEAEESKAEGVEESPQNPEEALQNAEESGQNAEEAPQQADGAPVPAENAESAAKTHTTAVPTPAVTQPTREAPPDPSGTEPGPETTPARSWWPLGLGAAGLAAVALAAFGILSGPPPDASPRWYLDLMPTANGLVPVGPAQRPSAPGQSLWRVTYDPKGRPETFVRVNGADYPWARDMENDVTIPGLRNVWEGETVTGIDVLNEAGSTVHALAFQREGDVLTVRHTHFEGESADIDCAKDDPSLRVRGHYTLDPHYPDFPCGRPLPIARYTVNDAGRLTEGFWFDAAETPTRGPDGAWGARYTWTDDGRILRRTALDATGNEMLGRHGIVAAVWTYTDKQWSASGVQFEAFAGIPASTPGKVSRVLWGYDVQGRRTDWTYENLQGEPAMHATDTCVAWRYTWTDNAKFTHCLDADGAPLRHPSGYHMFRTTLDARHYPIKQVYLDDQGTPIDLTDGESSLESTYDDLGRETQRGPSRTKDGTATALYSNFPEVFQEVYVYDPRGNRVEERSLDAEGALVSADPQHAIRRSTFDGLREVYVRYYDHESQPCLSRYGFAGKRKTWNDHGFIASETALDVNDQPMISQGDGWAETRYTYDDLGEFTRQAYFDAAGAPMETLDGHASIVVERVNNRETTSYFDVGGTLTPSEEGWARREILRNPLGLTVESRTFGADGVPFPDPETGAIGFQWAYDRMGRVIEERLLGDARTVPWVREFSTYNDRNDIIRVLRADENGSPAPFQQGAAYTGLEGDWDIDHRILEVRYLGADGERVVNENGCWAHTYTYDDNPQGEETCVPPPPGE